MLEHGANITDNFRYAIRSHSRVTGKWEDKGKSIVANVDGEKAPLRCLMVQKNELIALAVVESEVISQSVSWLVS